MGEYLVEHDLFDFLLLSLPDNDTHSHRHGPDAQVTSLVAADKQLERLMTAAGGADAFLEDHAVIVCSDHSQSLVEDEIDLFKAFDGFGVLPASRAREPKTDGASIALCPSSRAAQVYVLDRDERQQLVPRVVRTLLALEGVDLVMHLTDHPDGEAAVRSSRGELRFAPRGDLTDLRGDTWSVEGDYEVLALDVQDGACALESLSRCAGTRLVGPPVPHRRRGARVGAAGLGVPGLGRSPPRRGRIARVPSRERFPGIAVVVRNRPGQRRRARAMVAA